MHGIIYIFGPSCSGKSTLAKTLQQSLGDQWTYIDRDALIESGGCTDSTADKALEERIRAVGNKAIIDAQIPWAEKKQGDIYCLLLPPLETLLARDALRTERLQRPERRAYYAKEYVITTFNTLNTMDPKKFDVCLDSSMLPVDETASKVLQLFERMSNGKDCSNN